MAAIKPLEGSADKWMRRSAVAGQDYAQGIANPRRPWAQAAAEGGANYRTAVVDAANKGRFEAGVRRAGEEKWRASATAKGPSRFSEGVNLAVGQWQQGFGPYQTAINGLTLPPRGPAGSPNNLQRVSAVNTALRGVRERVSGAK